MGNRYPMPCKKPIWTPKNIEGLLLWLRSDKGVTSGSGVSAWADQSGNGYNATQSTSGKQPLLTASEFGTIPGVVFDGIDDFLEIDSSIVSYFNSPTKAFTIAIVYRLLADITVGVRQNIFSLGGDTYSLYYPGENWISNPTLDHYVRKSSGHGSIQYGYNYPLVDDADADFAIAGSLGSTPFGVTPHSSIYLKNYSSADGGTLNITYYFDGVWSGSIGHGTGWDGRTFTYTCAALGAEIIKSSGALAPEYFANVSLADIIVYDSWISSGDLNLLSLYISSRYM
jgi:hypothetical protein